MIALLDGDVVVYSVGFASEKQTEVQNCMNAELSIETALEKTGATSYRVYLSDSLKNNYRYAIDNNYKANRLLSPKPKFYESLRYFLKHKYKAIITLGQEADDQLGIDQSDELARCERIQAGDRPDVDPIWISSTVICSIDKDLLQVPGRHYNLRTGILTEVTTVQGLRSFYKQLLIGDRVDNITGVYGIGKVKAGHLLDGVDDEADMFERVRVLYGDDERLLRNGRLLWVRRREGQQWEFPCSEGMNLSQS